TALLAGAHRRPSSYGQFAGLGSYGNGAVMRAPIVGAWFADDLDRVVAEARLSAEVTHAPPEGIAGAGAVAVATGLACKPVRLPLETRSSKQSLADYQPPEFVSGPSPCSRSITARRLPGWLR